MGQKTDVAFLAERKAKQQTTVPQLSIMIMFVYGWYLYVVLHARDARHHVETVGLLVW